MEKTSVPSPDDNPLCARAFVGEPPIDVFKQPKIPYDERYQCFARRDAVTAKQQAVAKTQCYQRLTSESEFEYISRLLMSYGFKFKDLGISSEDDADEFRNIFQRVLWKIVRAYANNYDDSLSRCQKRNIDKKNGEDPSLFRPATTADSTGWKDKNYRWGSRVAIHTFGKPLVGFLGYEPPRHIWTVSPLGSVAAISWSFSKSGWWRFNWNMVQLGGFFSWADDNPVVSLVTAPGIEWQLPWFNGPILQPSLIVRGGYQFSSQNNWRNFTRTECGDLMTRNTNRCSAPVLQGIVSLAVLQRIRLELGMQYYPKFNELNIGPTRHEAKMMVLLGYQFLPVRSEPKLFHYPPNDPE
ncbi:MAG: hypothetical protein JXX29_10360 [Deltaproteobacteria bacterium]|nr:hypothetical protein [Deltaproteobacteria bacterium]MBN2672069.1 hypothetical protein [Deltaproteobacteria bacterium]